MSATNPCSRSTSRRPHRRSLSPVIGQISKTETSSRPTYPGPNASSNQTFDYICDFFKHLDQSLSDEGARELGQKLRLDGQGLLELPEADLVNVWGSQGRLLYSAVQSSKYGRVSNMFLLL